MKVVAFNGSPRADGNTAVLLQHLLEKLRREGCDTELVHIGGRPLWGCTACYQCFEQQDRRCTIDEDPVNGWIAKMIEADAIVFGTPTYFADLTSETKALIDRAGLVSRANGDMFKRKVGAAVVAVRRGGAIHAFDSINHFFLITQMIVPGSSYWNMGVGLDRGDVERDAEGLGTMDTLAQNMAWLLARVCRSADPTSPH